MEEGKMTLGEALIEHKTMKSELVRLMDLRESGFKYLEGEEPDLGFAEITAQIGEQMEDLRKLKMRIENTNHSVLIDTPEGKMSVSEAIHYIGDMRSELARLQGLKGLYSRGRWDFDEDLRAKMKYQIKQRSLIRVIGELEKKKARFDKFLSSWNWKVELTE